MRQIGNAIKHRGGTNARRKILQAEFPSAHEHATQTGLLGPVDIAADIVADHDDPVFFDSEEVDGHLIERRCRFAEYQGLDTRCM